MLVRMIRQDKLFPQEFEGSYAQQHYPGMHHNVPKLLQAMIDVLPGKGNQARLAERLSRKGLPITQPQISKWLRGQDPELRNYERILEVAGQLSVIGDVRSEDIAAGLSTQPASRKVKLKGYVGAGAQAHFYALADEDYEEVDAPMGSSDQTVAVEIKGKSFGPLMDTWLVFYDDIRSPITDDLLGKICVVGLADDRILIKQIKRERDGSFTLLSNSNEEPIEDAEIEWAALVKTMVPR